jgi:hypothetical protein
MPLLERFHKTDPELDAVNYGAEVPRLGAVDLDAEVERAGNKCS